MRAAIKNIRLSQTSTTCTTESKKYQLTIQIGALPDHLGIWFAWSSWLHSNTTETELNSTKAVSTLFHS